MGTPKQKMNFIMAFKILTLSTHPDQDKAMALGEKCGAKFENNPSAVPEKMAELYANNNAITSEKLVSELDAFCTAEKKEEGASLPWWGITLIVVGSVAVVAGGVYTATVFMKKP